MRAIVVADLVEAITSNGLDAEGKKNLNFTPAGGTARVQEHIERFMACTIESRRLIDAAAVNPHAADKRPHVVFVTAEKEYETHKTLPEFARKHLAGWCRSTFLNATADEGAGNDNVPGLEALHNLAPAQWHSPSWIYRQRPLAEGVTVVLMGRWSKVLQLFRHERCAA